jgi:hypothetical protein
MVQSGEVIKSCAEPQIESPLRTGSVLEPHRFLVNSVLSPKSYIEFCRDNFQAKPHFERKYVVNASILVQG